ncbi:hypothetical protein A8C56_20610 [Niabella ginsenosidivorans]|uniref:Uncharacterized protein n=1 Tax=Niabella ginsenosidivorans TaxID=1176587 RepID=A0A1A9I6V1_9BACT|nr:hypothetical protein A8C56_20610 [Niabella ginsenosidivorans]
MAYSTPGKDLIGLLCKKPVSFFIFQKWQPGLGGMPLRATNQKVRSTPQLYKIPQVVLVLHKNAGA